MAIYRMANAALESVGETTFARVGVSERNDLQRMLKNQIDIIAPGTLVIAEEFSDWEDSRRRVDLLGIDTSANLVVIELKRTEDGGHMELQAIRYAAMVSTLDFDRVVRIFESYLKANGDDRDARSVLLDHIGHDSPDEDAFAQDVRIVLASAEFSRELTTAVLWLNDRGIDIRCVRIKPYGGEDDLLLDVQQVIPLPEAQDYQVRLKEKQQKERRARRYLTQEQSFTVSLFGETLEDLPRGRLMFTVIRQLLKHGVAPERISEAAPWKHSSIFRSVEGSVRGEQFIDRVREEEERIGRRFLPERYFVDDADLVEMKGRTWAINRRWGVRTEDALANLARLVPESGLTWTRSS